MMALVTLGGCAWLQTEPPPEEPPVIVELTTPEKANTLPEKTPQAKQTYQPVYQQVVQPKPYYPLMKGFRVDKSVAVYPLDDWQPRHHSQ